MYGLEVNLEGKIDRSLDAQYAHVYGLEGKAPPAWPRLPDLLNMRMCTGWRYPIIIDKNSRGMLNMRMCTGWRYPG